MGYPRQQKSCHSLTSSTWGIVRMDYISITNGQHRSRGRCLILIFNISAVRPRVATGPRHLPTLKYKQQTCRRQVTEKASEGLPQRLRMRHRQTQSVCPCNFYHYWGKYQAKKCNAQALPTLSSTGVEPCGRFRDLLSSPLDFVSKLTH